MFCEDIKFNFDLICRLCTKQTADLQTILGGTLTKQVLQCTSIQIVPGDGMPESICPACLTRLLNSYEFRLQCQQSDTRLRQQLSYEKLENSVISSEIKLFQYQLSECDAQVTQQLSSNITYKSEEDSDADRYNENGQMVIVDGSDVTTIKPVKRIITNNQQESDCETTYPDIDIKVDESNFTSDEEVFSYPKIAIKPLRKLKRLELKPVQLNLVIESEVEDTEHENVGEEIRPKKKYPRNPKPKQCHICGKVCKWLPPHMLTHTGVRRYVCEYCTKSFKQLSHYKCHINIHTGNKPYACTMCEKRFHDSASKRSHIVAAHTKERNYICNICEKTFGHARSLLAHKKIHTQDRKHICSICCKAFLHKPDLTKHFRIHTGEKPYKCDSCDKTFSTSKNLQSHKRTHTKEKPFSCNICEKTFSHRNVLKTHLRIHQK